MTGTLDLQIVSGLPISHTSHEANELFFARRALSLLKTRLGSEGLIDLLSSDMARANSYWKQKLAESNGEFQGASVTLTAAGISATQFMAWFKSHLEDQPAMLGAHPEHFINGHTVLETVGEHVTFITLKFAEKPADCVTNLDPKYIIVLAATGVMRDGTTLGHGCHQLRDAEDGKGLEACFGFWIPKACEKEVVEMQTRHLAVEWRNWIQMAYDDLSRVSSR